MEALPSGLEKQSGMEQQAAAGEQAAAKQEQSVVQEQGGTAPACEAQDGVLRPRLKVTLELDAVLEHCRCSICMGIVKNARTVSSCMHRFCKDCIEAWLRTQIENNCLQCRAKFASKRDCKVDPSFDLLLCALFGDIPDFERRMLDPSAEVLEAARAVGVQIAQAKHQVAILPRPVARSSTPPDGSKRTGATAAAAALPSAGPQQQLGEEADVVVTVVRPSGIVIPGTKRPPNEGTGGPNKRLKPPGDDEEGLQFRGVRFQGDNWQARTKRNGKELSLGLYNSAEEAGMAYDIDRLHQQGGKAQRLNFPLLRAHYKAILTDLSDIYTPDGLLDFLAVAVQAAIKASRGMPGATVSKNAGPAATSLVNTTRRPAGQPMAQQQLLQQEQRQQSPPAGREDTGAAASAAAATTAVATALSPEEMQAVAARRAEQLAVERSLAAGLSGGVAQVRLLRGSGPSWRMAYLACPAGATMAQVAEAVAAGLVQQHALNASFLHVGLAVANDLDASADFDTLCAQDGATGNLLLRGHVAIRDLLGSLEDPLEDLCLEYHASPSGDSSRDGAGAGTPAILAAA